jgi:hypothetical protein
MSIVTRVRQMHRVVVVLVAQRLGLGMDARRHNHPPFGGCRAASLPNRRPSLHLSIRHHDPSRRRVLVRWQGWIGGLFS